MKLILKYLKGSYFYLIMTIFCCILSAFFILLSIMVVSYVIDNVIKGLPIINPLLLLMNNFVSVEKIQSNFIWVFYLVLFIFMCYLIPMGLRIFMQGLVSENLCEKLRNDLYKHIQELPYSFHVKTPTGELVQKCTSDINIIRRFFQGQFQEIIYALTTIIVGIIILLSINKELTIYAVMLLPILFIYALLYFKKVSNIFLDSDIKEGELTTCVQESLSGIRVIKAFGTEKVELEKFEKYNNKFRKSIEKLINALAIYWSTSDFICLVQIGIVVIMGIIFTNSGIITPGEFFIFFSFENTLVWPVRIIGRLLTDFGKTLVSSKRINEVLGEQEENYHIGIKPKLKGNIRFENVSFSYDDDIRRIINANFTINQGETVAIIGPTASGKSTLISLLNRLYEPTSGNIYIDDINIKDINLLHLRENIGVVLQEPFLFSKTISDNIKIANRLIDEDRIVNVAKIACVDSDIKLFEQGYNTLVGEKGVTLSGGQKQRVAIARTITNESPIIIFDDSLSAVDTKTDKNIRDALKTLNQDTTMIIITQRINSAKDADKIIILEDGKITDISNHNDLISKDGLYKRIYNIQSTMNVEELI